MAVHEDDSRDSVAVDGRLAAAFAAGGFVFTAETTPGASTDLARVGERAAPLKGLADAVNVTDGAGARAHVSSLAAAVRLIADGIEPVLQFTGRDRNRIALQGDLLGACALGVRNVLCLSGDSVETGDEPDAKPVFDLDGTGMTAMFARMRDRAELNSGRAIEPPPAMLIGVADLPIDPPADWRPTGLEKKIAAGADFVQTQYCFDLARARRYMARLADFGIPEKLKFLIGIGPLASARQARWMRENLFGVEIPDGIVDRLEAAADPRAEGKKICTDLLHGLREIPGVAGAHLMAPHQEAACAELIAESGLRG